MKLTVKSRLDILVLEKRLKTATSFARAMTANGYKLSTSQAARYLNETPPPAMNVTFIETACNVFKCLPSDLFDITLETFADENVDPLLAIPHHVKRITVATPVATPSPNVSALEATKRKKQPWEDEYGIAGPSIKPLPSPPKK